MDRLKIKVILGTTRENRFGKQPAEWIYSLAKNRESLDVELLDLRDYPMPIFDEGTTPSNANYDPKNEIVKKWTQKIEEADGFIIVTAEYNHGYPAVLKNAIDYIYKGWNNKVVSFVSYGSQGGARAVEQLRMVAVELQMASTRQAVHIVAPWNLLDDNGNLKTEPFEAPATVMLDQLTKWAYAFKSVRN